MLSSDAVHRLSQFLKSRWAHILSGGLLGLIYMFFAYAHLVGFLKSSNGALLIFAISEAFVVAIYIFRSKPVSISVRAYDWLVAIIGTFSPLFFRPADWGVLPIANNLIMLGAVIEIMSLLSLNYSFALVAAQRVIKTSWMYSVIRHPIYASYFLILLGYVLSNSTLQNGFVYVVSMVFLYLRILSEEKHLSLDPLYREYKLKVPYKLIPYII